MKDQVSEQLKRARINFRMAMGMTLSEMLDAGHYAPEATQPPTQDTPLRTDRTDAYEERIDAGKQMAQPPENPLNAQPSMINIIHPTDDELRSRRKELLEDLDYISGALREQPSQQDADVEEEMRGWVPEEPIRYNVQSKTPGAPVSWEFQDDPNGQWLEADSALTRIRGLERDLETLRTFNAELEDSRKKVLADNEYLREQLANRTTREAQLSRANEKPSE